jgi:hypothetical protein
MVVALASFELAACGTGTTEPGSPDGSAGAGAGGSSGVGGGGSGGHSGSMGSGGAGTADTGTPDSNSCVPQLPSGWVPTWKPPKTPTPNACTDAQIENRRSPCDDSTTYSAVLCNAYMRDPANADCQACMFSTVDESSYGAISLRADGSWRANVEGCIALVSGDLSATGCGAKDQANTQCRDDACTACPNYDSFIACRTAAGASVCSSYANNRACVNSPKFAICTAYATNKEYYVAMSRFFCSTGFPDGGVSDGGVSRNDGGTLDGATE